MSETNDNMDGLQRLLKLKRHEVPPPGYFNNLSGQVIARIRSGDLGAKETFFERLQSDAAFWDKVFHVFRVRPGLVGGLATSLCLVFLGGVVLLDHSESAPASTDDMAAQTAPVSTDLSPAVMASSVTLSPPEGGLAVSTNPVSSLQPVGTLLGPDQGQLLEPVDFKPASQ